MVTTRHRVQPVRIDEEMRTSYLSYAMSVIVSRALPDVRDGLKPVQRRILYAMHDMGMGPNTSYKKCARIVGEVLGKYHPHGDAPVYDALVRMAQGFSLRYPLVDGQGNFGSVDNDPPASMRYTEARLATIAEEVLTDIELDTVDFAQNFDDSLQEPTVLPSRLPNMLINGASGIAVGMATNIPPHNLSEVCNALCCLIDNPDATFQQLMELVPGPDFPTAGIIQGRSGIVDAYEHGRGRVVVQGRADIEEMAGHRYQIVITELPYQVNKATLVEKIAALARDKRVEGISDVRDESDRQGMRVVVELRRDAQAITVLNNLYRHTSLRSAFNVIMLAQVDGQPQRLSLRRSLQLFLQHRQRVVTRRSQHLLKKARDRAHIVEGLRLALEKMDEVVQIIRGSVDAETARQNLMNNLVLSEVQAQAILDMQLRRLAALERERLDNEYRDLEKTVANLEALLASPAKILDAIRLETEKLGKRFASPRRTEISEDETEDLDWKQYTQHEDVVVTLSRGNYIKGIPIKTYKLQHRGGKGVRGMVTREDDALQDLLVADTHDTLLFFTNRGRAYPLECRRVAKDFTRSTRGTPLVNLVPLGEAEKVNAVLAVPDLADHGNIFVLATSHGKIKALHPGQLAGIRNKGLIVMNLGLGDELVSVRMVQESNDLVVISEMGQSVRFSSTEVRKQGRAAGGVRGIRLAPNDKVIAMDVVVAGGFLLTASRHGYGKCTTLDRYRRQGRGGSGLRTFKVNPKTGPVAAARVVSNDPDQEILLASAKGQVIRIKLEDFTVKGRITQGVIIWRDRQPDDYVASLTCFVETDHGSGDIEQMTEAANRPSEISQLALTEIDESNSNSDE